MRIGKLLFSISLLLLGALGWADLDQAAAKMEKASTKDQVERVLTESRSELAPGEYERLRKLMSDENWGRVRREFRSLAAARRLSADIPPGKVADPKEEVQRIMRDPRYTDTIRDSESNWLAQSLRAFFSWLVATLSDIWQFLTGNLNPGSGMEGAAGILGQGVVLIRAVVWLLVAAAVIAALYFLFQVVRLPKRMRTKAGGLLDEDEPERTSDEWLEEAERLNRDGKVREAVRCLYLASLVRLDESNILRFHRWETNWEHLGRFESSSTRPDKVDLRSATKRFDLVWYGSRLSGSDYDELKGFYSTILSLAKEAA